MRPLRTLVSRRYGEKGKLTITMRLFPPYPLKRADPFRLQTQKHDTGHIREETVQSPPDLARRGEVDETVIIVQLGQEEDV